jgi:hypothetical protein
MLPRAKKLKKKVPNSFTYTRGQVYSDLIQQAVFSWKFNSNLSLFIPRPQLASLQSRKAELLLRDPYSGQTKGRGDGMHVV